MNRAEIMQTIALLTDAAAVLVEVDRVLPCAANLVTGWRHPLADELLGTAAMMRSFLPQPMETAPTDGTRVLIQHRKLDHNPRRPKHIPVPTGTSWTECRFKDGRWREWCGFERIDSTATIDPLQWMPLPPGGLMSDRPKTLRQAWWDTYQQWLDAVERQRPVETKDLTEARQHADAVVCGLSQVTSGSVIPEGV